MAGKVRWPTKSAPGAVRKTPANEPGWRRLVWVARREALPRSREGARVLIDEGCATWRAIPLVMSRGKGRDYGVPGAAKNTGDVAWLFEK